MTHGCESPNPEKVEMAKKKSKSRTKTRGSMMSMRRGVKGMVGQKRKGKQEISFATVMGWIVVIAVLGIVTWSLGGV
jgi:hypothetical protein